MNTATVVSAKTEAGVAKPLIEQLRDKMGQEYVFDMPGNDITSAGRWAIQDLLYSLNLPRLPYDWDWAWVVSVKGLTYTGNLPKRISKFYKITHDIKLDTDVLGKIGTLASQNRPPDAHYIFDFTDSFLWEPGSFGESSSSCWWNEYREARYLLMDSGGLAIRFYDFEGQSRTERGVGRCWIASVPNVEDAVVCFNGYGYEARTVAAMLSAWLHLGHYKQTDLGNTGGAMYINSGTGYLVGDFELIKEIEDVDLGIDNEWRARCKVCECDLGYWTSDLEEFCEDHEPHVPKVECHHCGYEVPEEYAHYAADDEWYCEDCISYYGPLFVCSRCNAVHPRETARILHHHWDARVCEACYQHDIFTCAACGRQRDRQLHGRAEIEGDTLCHGCASISHFYCSNCRAWKPLEEHASHRDTAMCQSCFDQRYFVCEKCGQRAHRGTTADFLIERHMCNWCYSDLPYAEQLAMMPEVIVTG